MWSENSVQTMDCENWGILSDEWRKLTDENWLTKQALTRWNLRLSSMDLQMYEF